MSCPITRISSWLRSSASGCARQEGGGPAQQTVPQGHLRHAGRGLDAQEEDNTQAMTEALPECPTPGGHLCRPGLRLWRLHHQTGGLSGPGGPPAVRYGSGPGHPAHPAGPGPEHQDAGFITIFYGEDVTEEQAQKAADIFTEACPSAEINLLPGGQPVYYYMISLNKCKTSGSSLRLLPMFLDIHAGCKRRGDEELSPPPGH